MLFVMATILLFSHKSIASTYLDGDNSDPKSVPIVVEESAKNIYRSPLVPFEMYYQSGEIRVDAYYDIGLLSVLVVNATTGESWSETVDTAFGTTSVDIYSTHQNGNYELYITDERGNNYRGNFSLQ